MSLTCLLVNVLLVEQEDHLELVVLIRLRKLVQILLHQRDLEELCPLLLKLLVSVSHDLLFLLELVS